MFKLADRNSSQLILAPTHEEEITTLVAGLVTSWRQLPLRVYQIGRKFRDEMRPRAGLLRAKEFIMKDMYTFDATADQASSTYNDMSEAYRAVFKRIGVEYIVVF